MSLPRVLAEMESLFGLPAHPLVVHAAVVLIPLAAIGVFSIAFWPAARRRIGWVVLAVAFVGMVSAFLAQESGESLEETVPRTEAVRDHADLGESGILAGGLVFVGAAAIMAVDVVENRRVKADPTFTGTSSTPGSLRTIGLVVGAVAVVLAGLGTARIVQIGHSGATATWEDNELSSTSSSVEGDRSSGTSDDDRSGGGDESGDDD
jgi:hypothetical protein